MPTEEYAIIPYNQSDNVAPNGANVVPQESARPLPTVADDGSTRMLLPQSIPMLHLMIVETGDVIEQEANAPMILGRRGSGKIAQIDLTAHHAHELGVSRNHAMIEPADGRVMVKDLGSTNGTRLNGEKLEPMTGHEISNGDVIKLGRMHIRVYFVGM